MKFVSDPPIDVKIRKMKQRVRWLEPSLVERGIDQTRMVLDDGLEDNPEFSFLVVVIVDRVPIKSQPATTNHRINARTPVIVAVSCCIRAT
jgi:hypothetical protein